MSSSNSLTPAQRTRVAKNRQKAIQLRAEKSRKRTFSPTENCDNTAPKAKQSETPSTQPCDPVDDIVELSEEEDDFPDVDPAMQFCEDCGRQFMESYLYDHFGAIICDRCRDSAEKHRLISRTEAKDRYLLKDHDFDKREPVLKFVLKKNPRNAMWGDMKLYLEIQVAERAMLVWGSEETLEEEKGKRIINREKTKQKKYSKKLKDLRVAVRSSLGVKQTATHEHEYGEETYDSDEDMYCKACLTCENKITYEKM